MTRFWEFLEGLEPNRKLALAIVAPILILLGYYFLVVSPRLARTEGLRAHIDNLLQERDRKVVEAGQMPDRKKDVAELEIELKKAITRLPDEKEIPELLSSISNLGRDSGLDIIVFRQKPEGYEEFYAEVPVEMQVRGTYHQVATFVDAVGKLDRIVNVSDIGMKDAKLAEAGLVLQATAQITTFRFLSEAERQRLIKEKKIKGEATP
jgi:type IV pilus assembly protein PilO